MKNWLAIISITFALFAGTVGAIEYFAKATDLELVAARLEQKILNDQLMYIQQEMWMLEDRHHGKDCSRWPQQDKDRYRTLQMQKDQLERELSK